MLRNASLCPCSKDISGYGAHNQRSHIEIDTEMAGQMAIEELIAIAGRGCLVRDIRLAE